jgi:hypothetical protein
MSAKTPRHDGKGGNLTFPRWTAEDLALLDSGYGILPIAELARKLGRTIVAVQTQARKRRLAANLIELHTLTRLLGVCDYTIRRWVKAGVLKAHRSRATARETHRVRVRRGDLYDFLRDYRFLYDAPLIADPELRRYVAQLPPERERWQTPKEAQRALVRRGIACSDFTVRNWLRKGDLAGVLICGRYWISDTALRAFTRPVTPSLKGRKRAGLAGQSPEREALRRRNKAETGALPVGRRHVTGPTEIGARGIVGVA